MKKHKTVDDYIEGNSQYSDRLQQLRKILLSCNLEETVKWGAPVYTYKGKNVVGIGAFKSYCGLWFYQGALINDFKGMLINAQEGVTNALRQWRFRDDEALDAETLVNYVQQAISNVEKGNEIKPQSKPLVIPDALQEALNNDPELKNAYESFSLSHKREYAEYISEAKREATRQNRLKKIIPMILGQTGLNDKYRKTK